MMLIRLIYLINIKIGQAKFTLTSVIRTALFAKAYRTRARRNRDKVVKSLQWMTYRVKSFKNTKIIINFNPED